MLTNRLKQGWSKYRTEILIVAGGLIFMHLIFIPPAFRQGTAIDRTAAGQLGDFVGGYIGTLFGLVSVVLLYVTLKTQRAVNEREHFESKYFELLKMHRDNVAELELGDDEGRKVFVLLIREFRLVLAIVRRVATAHKRNYLQGNSCMSLTIASSSVPDHIHQGC